MKIKAFVLTAILCFSLTIPAYASRDLPIYSVQRDDRAISLTFDAAWGNEDTEKLIEILGKYNIRATFFVVGDWADKYPCSVKSLYDAGHEIMSHSNKHGHYTDMSREEMIKDVNISADKIQAITGERPILFRAPYGDYNDTVVSAVRDAGFYTIQWDVDSLDWKNPGVEAIQQRVLDKVCPGSIILFHNAAEQTPDALPYIIENLKKQGYTFLPVSELIYRDNYTIDATGKQICR